MKISKGTFIYAPKGEHSWDYDTFMTPHAMLLNDEVIRVYGGVRDKHGISRIIYLDVEAKKPENIIQISDKPVLDIGEKGCFDDNGMILGDIVNVEGALYMYYVGFQHVQKVKFYAFSGLAISTDGGETFQRHSQVPVLDRTETGRFGRCIHTVLYEDNLFKCYYAVINGWKHINHIPYPVYNIWYTQSEDGIHFPAAEDDLCIDTRGQEYRIGRPKVYKTKHGYEMYYTRDLVTKEYVAGYACSEDGKAWTRKDEELKLVPSGSGFDSEMACYPVKLKCNYGTYLFYNGNGMGKEGFGYVRVQ